MRYKHTPEGAIPYTPEEEAKADADALLFAQLRSDEEKREIRFQRNQKLTETDWTQGKDIPDATSTAWASYRQALRDIPQQAGFPQNVVWPVKPV